MCLYITLYYITLHYTTLHYTTLHCVVLHYTTLHYITLHCIALHYIALHCITRWINIHRHYTCMCKFYQFSHFSHSTQVLLLSIVKIIKETNCTAPLEICPASLQVPGDDRHWSSYPPERCTCCSQPTSGHFMTFSQHFRIPGKVNHVNPQGINLVSKCQ